MPEQEFYNYFGAMMTIKDLCEETGLSDTARGGDAALYRVKNEYLTVQQMADRVGIKKKTMQARIYNLPRSRWLEPRHNKGPKRSK